MYELTKKRSSGYYIIFGIIVFAFITAVLKMAFQPRQTTLNDDLIKAANEINSHAPIIIDSTTRLDRVNTLSEKILQYNYTLLTVDKTEIDTNVLKSSGKEAMIQQMKQDSKSAIFRDNGIEVQATYTDKNGATITTISILPNEY